MKELYRRYKEIQKMGYVPAVNNYNSGIGLTFEKLLGLSNNDLEIPDYNGIEIKTRRAYSKSFITLFNATPDGEYLFQIKRIQKKYGYYDMKEYKHKVFNASIFSNQLVRIGKYFFKIYVDYKKEKIFLNVYNKHEKLIDQETSWSFKMLEEKLNRKLSYLAVAEAWPNKIDGRCYYKYYQMKFYKLKKFEDFLKAIDKGIIRITFTIGVFRTGRRKGQIYDHGTGFEISNGDLYEVFDYYRIFDN